MAVLKTKKQHEERIAPSCCLLISWLVNALAKLKRALKDQLMASDVTASASAFFCLHMPAIW